MVHNVVLGSGTYGSVYLATCNSVQVAIKTSRQKRPWLSSGRSSKISESDLMRVIDHLNVQGLLDSMNAQDAAGAPCELHVLELVTGGDMFSYLAKYNSFTEAEVQFFGWQLLKGLEYLHQRDIAHRGQLSPFVRRRTADR